ncbi:DUF2339 domain-containing protein [Microbacterium hydrocarbonoxydans]|uniref:DUF2339 domain-containing protein n=1 Tax=Microbacterium hydrocarbonoxydans TaxID=273678 RepID=UPI0013DB394A|nr:DUF2339 domain-containing protein [Microbacterium hydrocarbonoxydans]
MILDWVAQTPVFLVAILVVFVPGAAALSAVGMRGLAMIAAAPLFTVVSTALVAVLFGAVGVPWSPVSWGILSLAMVGVAWGAGRLLGGRLRSHGDRAASWMLPTAVVIGILFGLWRLISYISDPAGISQTNDAVFHMNAIRFVLETSDASSLHINEVIGGRSFYPAAWHGLVSIIVMATGTSIPIAANMLTLVIGAIIWPLGITWLSLLVTASRTAAASAAILSSALQNFPLLMFQWGVLFPNALSVALIPAGVAVVMSFAHWTGAGSRPNRIARAVLLVLMTAGALALSQPSALLPWAALVLVWFTARLLVGHPESSIRRRWVLIAGLWLALGAAWIVLARSTSGSHWPPFRGKLEVFLDVLFNGQLGVPFAFVISLLMLWGLVVAWRGQGLRWFVFAWLGISTLYLIVAAVGAPIVRENLLGAWYADPYRIAALAPIVVIPLAALGLDDVMTRVAEVLRRRRAGAFPQGTASPIVRIAGAAVIMSVLVLVRPVAMPAFLEGTFDSESRYLAVDDSYLSPDERTLLERLPDYVEPGARVLGNPSTGTGFGYMFSGVDVYPRTWSSPQTEAWALIGATLRDASEDPAVCEALHVYGDPAYVLDFGVGEKSPGRFELPGMTDFEGQAGFEEITAVGDVSLWRITACAR